jgi:hypothetical protein
VESVFPNERIFYINEQRDAVDRINTGRPAALDGRHAKDFAQLTSFGTTLRQMPRRERLPDEQQTKRHVVKVQD